jgi:DNA-binding HxlR family transcriptional regulator
MAASFDRCHRQPQTSGFYCGSAGFRALSRAVDGISDSMLSDRLAELCAAGLVERRVTEGPPLAVRYELSHAGRALPPALERITRWAERYLPA